MCPIIVEYFWHFGRKTSQVLSLELNLLYYHEVASHQLETFRYYPEHVFLVVPSTCELNICQIRIFDPVLKVH